MIYARDRSVEDTERIEAFTEEVAALCDKYKVTISHEDSHGAFILELHGTDDRDREFFGIGHHWGAP